MAKVEDVLEVYPITLVGINKNKQLILIKETRVPAGCGSPEKVDSVYAGNGVADVFRIAEPLAEDGKLL